MGIFGVFVVWIGISILLIIQGIHSLKTGEMFPIKDLWQWILLWVVTLGIMIGFILYRRYTQKQFSNLYDVENSNNLQAFEDGQYFYQAPYVTMDKQYIPIHGNNTMYYTANFNNIIQKWISITGFFPLFGVFVKSENHTVKIKRIKFWSLHAHYEVYLDNTYIGILRMQKLFKEKGMKQQLPFIFDSNKGAYQFNNPYFSMNTVISKNNVEVFSAERSFFDLSKSHITKRRGERHNIRISRENKNVYPDEVLIALYIQVMLNKRTENNG
ncbi:hypothetical protein [Staphylococcus argensis]|uniref:Uncharacterized protein n=1 Tax=Staphylococcus argensis TaxID=1607738 RepID=A0A2K4FAT6_9STAP|nr:hypothetical protein [Staphylococcus argensis]MCY6991362.1 hypothetical protein [Staphylococcus argensis]POA08401.1 hypothetical protein CD039_09980 [Staphylococcus argensis]